MASLCHGQTLRRNYEFPDVGGAIGSFPIGSIPDDALTISMMANGDWGDFSITTNVASLDADVVGPDELADGDYGDVTFASGSITIDAGAVSLSDLVAGSTAGDMLYWTGSAWAADIAPVVGNGGGPGLGSGKGRIKFNDDTIDVVAIRTATLRIQYQEDDTAIVTQ
jgi:hypothetical protein